MHEHLNWFTVLLNEWLGSVALARLALHSRTPKDSTYPIPNIVAARILVVFTQHAFLSLAAARISVDRPGGTQQVMEMLLTNSMGVGIRDLLDENVDHEGRDYVASGRIIGIFMLFATPLACYRLLNRPQRVVPAFRLRLRDFNFHLLQLERLSPPWADRIRQAFCRPRLVAGLADFPGRNDQPHGSFAFAHRPFVGQHFRQRTDLCDLFGTVHGAGFKS